ncbi:MAG: beta-N-acetylhexosaminidase [Candidatus Thiosymbion ectosymbiont of Robbea hypermnestra]|nr:beta-N-acetylhexosaminidase [Candidatus Thiosymbion ectosymbiont of Robbea hypermnestra]
MSLGPVMLDLTGVALDAEEREILRHPAVGGVILFTRNFEHPEQVAALTAAIHDLRDPHLLVAVDQEGGRIQRFREGFTRLPPAGRFGALSREHPVKARRAAGDVGWLMAAELRAVGVDFSFAPVLDLDRGISRVIGDRAFAASAAMVTELAIAWRSGMYDAGMAAVGKHFPGHGGVAADSHTELPVDDRPLETLEREDLIPFEYQIRQGLEAIMPAHVVYPAADPDPAGFSAFWLRRVLRERLGFQGVIFSDDLNMAAAAAAGDYAERSRSALAAGCDVLLICNNRPAALEMIESLDGHADPTAHLRCLRMHGRGHLDRARLHLEPRWQQALHAVAELAVPDPPSLEL